MLTRAPDAPVHTTPNATMRTLAAPSLGASALSVWEVVMDEGAAAPAHRVDAEQVWVVLEGRLRVELDGRALEAGADDALTLPAGAERRVSATTTARALVSSPAAPTVATEDGGARPLPWAA